MELIKQIIESIGNLLKNFTKESNKVKVFLYLLGFILIFFIGYYFYSLQQKTIESNLELQKMFQEEKNKRIEVELEKDKLQIQNQGKIIDSMKDLKPNNEIGGNMNGSIGNNNETTNQTNSGGIMLANSHIENSSVNIVNVVLSDYTKYSSGELSKYITDLKNNDSLKIADADEIIKQVSNTPTNTDEERQKQEDLINTLFQKFSFDTNGYTTNGFNFNYYRNNGGCKITLEKIIPIYSKGKYYLKLGFGINIPNGKTSCNWYTPKEVTAYIPTNESLGTFYSDKEVGIFKLEWDGGGTISTGEPITKDNKGIKIFYAQLHWIPASSNRKITLQDIQNLILEYKYLYFINKYEKDTDLFKWEIKAPNKVTLIK